MASSITLYDNAVERSLNAKNLLLPTGTFKITLHTSTYTFSAAHAAYADLTNELSTGFGYTAGGGTLTTPVITLTTTNDAKFDADDYVWTAAGGSIPAWRCAVIRRSDTVDGVIGPLIAYIVGNTTGPTDIPATTDTNTLTVAFAAGGIITFTY